MTDRAHAEPDPQLPPVCGVFPDTERADDAVMRLFRAGIHVSQVSYLAPEGEELTFDGIEREERPAVERANWAGAGTAVGAVAGSGLSAAAVTGAGIGAAALAGPLFVGLAGGAVAGGFVGAMLERGVESDVADKYVSVAGDGAVLLAVQPRMEEQIPAIRDAFAEAGYELESE